MKRSRIYGSLISVALAPLLALGCVATIKDQGEVAMFFGTALGIRTTSSTTNAESEAALHSQPLEDWWASRYQRNADFDSNGVGANGVASQPAASPAPKKSEEGTTFSAFTPSTSK